ncbi:MAG: hypothetical protein AAB389_03445 [Patescibacteria group bacterium]
MDQRQIKTSAPMTWEQGDAQRRTDNKLPAFRISDEPISPDARREASRRIHKHVIDEEMQKWAGLSRTTGIFGSDETDRYCEVQLCETCLKRMHAVETGKARSGDSEQYRQTQAHLVAVDVRKVHLTADEIRNWPELMKVRVDHVNGCEACTKRVAQLEVDRKESAKSFGRSVMEFFTGLVK